MRAGSSRASLATHPTLQTLWFSPGRQSAKLRRSSRQARRHSQQQIRQLADAIRAVGFLVPIVVDERGTVLAGHARLEAACQLGLPKVPVVRAEALSEAQKRVFMLADNRIAQNAGWDRAQLAIELAELPALLEPLGLELTATGFDPPEILEILTDQGDAVPIQAIRFPARRPRPSAGGGSCGAWVTIGCFVAMRAVWPTCREWPQAHQSG